jgi:hypothetical protein
LFADAILLQSVTKYSASDTALSHSFSQQCKPEQSKWYKMYVLIIASTFWKKNNMTSLTMRQTFRILILKGPRPFTFRDHSGHDCMVVGFTTTYAISA